MSLNVIACPQFVCQEFEQLEKTWHSYFEAKQDEERKAQKTQTWDEEDGRYFKKVERAAKSASSWSLSDLSRYIKAFSPLSWHTSQCFGALKIQALESYLQRPPGDRLEDAPETKACLEQLRLVLQVIGSPVSDHSEDSEDPLDVEPIDIDRSLVEDLFQSDLSERSQGLRTLLETYSPGPVHLTFPDLKKGERQKIHTAVNRLAKQGHLVQSVTERDPDVLHIWMQSKAEASHEADPHKEIFRRLAGLANLQGREASSRAVIDALLFPLCAQMQTSVTLEEGFKLPLFPSSVCDYVIRANATVLAVIEAKRCAPNWIVFLSQGVAQCVWQLAILQKSQEPKPQGGEGGH